MRNPAARKFTPTLCLIVLFAWPLYAEAGEKGDWDIRIGAGVRYDTAYEGSDEMKARAFPLVNITWKDLVFLNPRDGLGVRLSNENLTFSAGIGYVFGRDESDSNDLSGMGDIDDAAAANLGVEYDIGPLELHASVSRHLGGSDGTLAKAGIEGIVPLALLTGTMEPQAMGDGGPRGPALWLGASISWADDNYMESYFGVNSIQSLTSGHARYTAESGFKSVDVDAGVIYPFLQNWAVNAQVGYSQLLSDAADSPIVMDKDSFSGGLFLAYRF